MDIYQKLTDMQLELPPPPAKGGVYMPVKKMNERLYYISGCGPKIGEQNFIGKLGKELTLEEGQMAARNCILNILSAIEDEIGDLNRIRSFVKVLVFIASETDFFDQPLVANGATGFLVELFGEDAGCPSRSAIAVNVLPGNIAVEIEGIVEID